MSVRNLNQISQSFLSGLQKKNPNLTPHSRKQDSKKSDNQDNFQEYINPIFTTADYKETIARYNRYIKKYNLQVWKENARVRDYNRKVIRYRRSQTITSRQKADEYLWKEERKDYTSEGYNREVEAYNDKNSLLLRKKNLKEEVKPTSEKVFIALLYELNIQLFERKRMRQKLNLTYKSEIPAVKIYPNKIVERERDGYENLPISKTTFRHHRERLEEAGVLLDYQFQGTKRPVKMRLNPEILAVTDNGNPKNAPAENQSVSSLSSKKVAHSNVFSRKLLDKDKIREKGDFCQNNKPERAKIDNNGTEYSTRTPKKRKGQNLTEKKKPARGKMPETSKKWLGEIQNPEDLAADLSAGAYSTYRRMDPRALEQEAAYGGMDQPDFVELAIQDIFCFSAVLFEGMPVHPGSWVNAIKIWRGELFRSPNGHYLSKPNILSRWQRYIKVLETVKRYQEHHPEWEIRYPSLYFDPIRKNKEDSSFAYALRNFRVEEKPTKTKTQRKLAHLRTTRQNTDVKKAQMKIREYLRQKIDIDTLLDYVQNNCVPAVYENINKLIKKEFNRMEKMQ